MKKQTTSIFLIAIVLLLSPIPSIGQYFVAGQDPSSIRWRQIQTEHFQIIYPDDDEEEGQSIAGILEKVYVSAGNSLNHQPRKISVILHTKTIQSNGFVAWSPARVELFTTPNQELYSQKWLEQLAIHEFRHNVQIDKVAQELPKIYKILLGEQAASIVLGAYMPFWLLEGDAVAMETSLSNSGRGRMPSFSMELKAIADENRPMSFSKAYLGSYKDYVPDYYKIGYQIVGKVRQFSGGDVWGKVIHYIARNPLSFNALSKGLILASGKSPDQWYQFVMSGLKREPPFNFGTLSDCKTEEFSKIKPRNYASYRYSFLVNDSTAVSYKSSLEHQPAFVLLHKSGEEKILMHPGNLVDASVSYSKGQLLWAEIKPDLRWSYQEKTLIRNLQIDSGHLDEYVMPDKVMATRISRNGNSFAAIRFDGSNHCSLMVCDLSDGHLLVEIKAKADETFLTPTWSEDNQVIYFVVLTSKGKSIAAYRLKEPTFHIISGPFKGEISKPIEQDSILFYTSNQEGKDQGYAMNLRSGGVKRLISGKYGVCDIEVDSSGNHLIYSNYSAKGYQIFVEPIDRLWKKAIEVGSAWHKDSLAECLSRQEGGRLIFQQTKPASYQNSAYLKHKNLLNIHSWAPVYIDPDQAILNTGFSIFSQNKLTTAITQLGYEYSSINNSGHWIGKMTYSGWYPVVTLYGDYGHSRSQYFRIDNVYNNRNVLIRRDTTAIAYSYREMNTHLDLSIPFNFTHGNRYRMAMPEIQIGYSQTWQNATTPSGIFHGSYIPVTYRFYGYNLSKQAPRDIQPSFGEILELQYRHTPWGDKKSGTVASAEGTFFFPGMAVNHGLKLYAAIQQKSKGERYFNDLVQYPRGLQSFDNVQLMILKSDYVLPLCYPDLSVGRIFYLKRLQLRLHYDLIGASIPILQTNSTTQSRFQSYGGEFTGEFHLLRFYAPIRTGVRISKVSPTNQTISEFLLSINLKEK